MSAPWPLPSLSPLLIPALQDRLVLLINHVVSREAVAMQRLRPWAGRTLVVSLSGWPSLLPALPDLVLRITPAGLFEREQEAVGGDLRVELDAANPARLALGAFSGETPSIKVQGDAALAGDLNWLADNLRWDLEDDLAGLVGPLAARQLAQLGRGVAAAVSGLAQRWAPSGAGAA